ncbi:MAG: flavodoxin family protein [Planctomycetes bacterium]|nr:flavodoxin family protein [Planctomycetota bacterium]
MSAILFNGSPRKGGNTEICLRRVTAGLESEGIATEIVRLADLEIQPCRACVGCRGRGVCTQDDGLNDLLPRMIAADAIIIGSPTWFGSVTGHVKNLIDRAGYVSRTNGHMFRRKVGAPVIAARRAGAVQVYNEIASFFAINHFYMVGSSYWNFAFGREPGEVEEDAEGMKSLDDLAANMAFLLKALRAAG